MRPPTLISSVKTTAIIALVLGLISLPFAQPVWPQLLAALAAGAAAAAIIGLGKEDRRQEWGVVALLEMIFVQNFARDIWPRPASATGAWHAFIYTAQSGAALALGFSLCGFLLFRLLKKPANQTIESMPLKRHGAS
jgi:hypothetical protein